MNYNLGENYLFTLKDFSLAGRVEYVSGYDIVVTKAHLIELIDNGKPWEETDMYDTEPTNYYIKPLAVGRELTINRSEVILAAQTELLG